MKKAFLRVMSFAVIAALVWVGCSDNGVQDKNAEVGEFVNMFVGGGARYTLSVGVSPTGGGTVSRVPDTTSYKAGSKVAVTAAAATGFRFVGWTGDVINLSDSITVTISKDIALTANFIDIYNTPYILTVNPIPDGGGTVSRNPNLANYRYGDSVIVTAMAADGYVFVDWAGASSSTEPITTVLMDNHKTLTANFTSAYTLTINVSPPSSGLVSRRYDISGRNVTVTAVSANGYTFIGWSGASTSTSDSVTITMDGDKTLTAHFQEAFVDNRDGKTYKKVVIGGATWMAENLNYQTDESWCFGEGEGETVWDYDIIEYKTISDAEMQANCNKYGRLYTWDAAKTACPAGWHLPDTADWNRLVTAAGGVGVSDFDIFDTYRYAGNTLKSSSGWYNDGNGTDDFGFSALPGGHRQYGADAYSGAGYTGTWWTATAGSSGNDARVRFMYYSYDDVMGTGEFIGFGISVRCIQD